MSLSKTVSIVNTEDFNKNKIFLINNKKYRVSIEWDTNKIFPHCIIIISPGESIETIFETLHNNHNFHSIDNYKIYILYDNSNKKYEDNELIIKYIKVGSNHKYARLYNEYLKTVNK